jgi:hypothetical protein
LPNLLEFEEVSPTVTSGAKGDPLFHHPGGKMWEGAPEESPKGFYFWDETWTNFHGPFKSESKARLALKKYGDSL